LQYPKNVEIRAMGQQLQFYTMDEVAKIIQPLRVRLAAARAPVVSLLYDSRKLSDVRNGLFFALKGKRDGHHYVADAYVAGVRNFVVTEETIDINSFPEANFLVVTDTLDALQVLAAHHRRRFAYPVIGITGSNGKTIVKEWLGQLLAKDYRIIRSPKSYNSQIGVALSLWQLSDAHDLAIIEAGISKSGEMERLHAMIKPDIAVLTTIGPAHDDGFFSREEKISEKLRLFEGAARGIGPETVMNSTAVPPVGLMFTWGPGDATLQVLRCEKIGGKRSQIHARYDGKDVEINIPFTDRASQENAACCWAVMLSMGYEQEVIAQRIANLHPVEMRLEMKKGINHCTLVDDSYSNDLSSLGIALEFVRQQHQHTQRTLILSDIPGAAETEEKVYTRVADLLEASRINRLITVGPALAGQASKFGRFRHDAFLDVESLIAALPGMTFRDEIILLKGARSYAFERISRLLAAKIHDTVLEINLNALEYNLNQYKSLLSPHVKLMAMVKAFSYGSGSFEVANLLQFNQVDYLAVAYTDEGVELRKAGITTPIMVMSPGPNTFDTLVAYQLEPEIYSFNVLEQFMEAVKNKELSHYPIHIKVDTGMHRLGFDLADTSLLASKLSGTSLVKVQSVFSHLAASGDPQHDAFTEDQLARYGDVVDRLRAALTYPFIRHIANTAGTRRWPQAHLDMVRLGIGLYGIGSAADGQMKLQQVGTLKTVITQLRHVPAGEHVGYGRTGMLAKDSTIATVNIGYADGYDRRFGNGVGYMTLHGRNVPTVGDICMDMTMLDITGVEAREGDEVIVFGDVAHLAGRIGTIPYELLTGISQRVKRVYYYG